ncbi:tetratricopeptide repeat protein [bacterium]|nr:tetratricopeptide repeat protein [bacterium]
MSKKIAAFILIPTLLLTTMASAASERCNNAMRLYQEGLLQETGIGEIADAKKIYLNLINKYQDQTEILAAAFYRLGLMAEKSGQNAEARKYFNIIIERYAGQKKTFSWAEARLKQLAKPEKDPRPQLRKPQIMQTPLNEETEKTQPQLQSLSESISLTGIGINGAGINILEHAQGGIHLRFDLNHYIVLEAKTQYRDDLCLAGGRGYVFFEPIRPQNTVRFYSGAEGAAVISGAIEHGYMIGSFIGLELRPGKNIGIGGDIGYYYQKSIFPDHTEMLTMGNANLYVTFYF